ncbi:hypothetical protein F5884DRAFT_467234 [Xylogone sp. PMI_703]|nr:hypothetical protein F5884DRAFT_467234 [Xylogone sp. PMI_703]
MFSQAVFAALCLASSTTAHMIMSQPVPFGKSSLDNSPLIADGSNFPCKQRTGVYDAEGAMNIMPLGSSQPLSFVGSATHGGGSCQISISYDKEPTKSSTWKVIHSIEGGCPVKGQAGNIGNSADTPDPDTYSFPVPTSLPTGTATLAWTWFNKVGNREMYMNCAPVSITAGSSKRSPEDEELMARNVTALMERDQAAYDALPDMFVANIGNGCGTQDSTDLLFPNPGDSVEQDGLQTSSALAKPTGNCQAPTGGAASPTAGGAAAPAASSPAAAAASASPATTAAPAVSAGIFATVAASSPVATSAAAPPPVASTPAPAPAPVAATTSSMAAASPSEAPIPAPAPASTGSSGSGSTAGAMTAGTACSPEGTWNCIDGTSYQRCASGMWSVVQQMAAGTTCSAGQVANMNIVDTKKVKKTRSIRFSREHIKRNAQLF